MSDLDANKYLSRPHDETALLEMASSLAKK
ncbi:hypothetical protein KGM_211374A, partial [Danaus plexippus plexippus]